VSLLLVALLIASVQAACPADPGDPGEQASAALVLYEQLEVERFQAQVHALHQVLPCLRVDIEPQAAAQLHLVTALEAWTRRDEQQVQQALRALLALQPGYQPSVVVAPEGGGLAAAFDAARAAGPGVELPYPGLSLVVDGQPGATLPQDRAAVVQWYGTGGFESHYGWPGQLDGALRRAARLGGGAVPSTPVRVSHRSRSLAIAAAATGLVALVGAGQANDAWDAFRATDSWPDAQRYYTRNRVFAVGSGITGVGALGLAAGAVVVWEW
jgi:hypothetical protein